MNLKHFQVNIPVEYRVVYDIKVKSIAIEPKMNENNRIV